MRAGKIFINDLKKLNLLNAVRPSWFSFNNNGWLTFWYQVRTLKISL